MKYLIHIQYYEENTVGISYGENKEQAIYNFINHILEIEEKENNNLSSIYNLPLFYYNEDKSREENITYYINEILDFPITCIELSNKDEIFYAEYNHDMNTDKYNKYIKK